jgi:HSP20 family protein
VRPRRDIERLQEEVQELFADLWQVPRFTGRPHRFRPQCDCFRTAEPPALHVVLELPGVDPESLQVSPAGRALVVSGRRERPRTPGARYQLMEIEYGDFQRRIDLSEDVDIDAASTTYERGMLRIVLPLEGPT